MLGIREEEGETLDLEIGDRGRRSTVEISMGWEGIFRARVLRKVKEMALMMIVIRERGVFGNKKKG